MMPKFFRRCWCIYYDAAFIFLFLFFFPLFYFWLKNPRHWRKANQLRRIWARILFFITAIRPRVQFETPLDTNGVYVFTPNHSSKLDIPLFAIAYNGYNHFMGKKELRDIPLFGIFFRTMDISVNRESKMDSYRAYKRALQDLDLGASICMFPEGTTNDHAPSLLPFKSGPFRLAIERQVPVVPVTLLDNWRLYLYDGSRLCSPGITRAVIHTPIPTAGMTIEDADLLREKVFTIIDQTLKHYHES
jgi:1-acyl-sn-glycerol-3-phosphate acyltransferase